MLIELKVGRKSLTFLSPNFSTWHGASNLKWIIMSKMFVVFPSNHHLSLPKCLLCLEEDRQFQLF